MSTQPLPVSPHSPVPLLALGSSCLSLPSHSLSASVSVGKGEELVLKGVASAHGAARARDASPLRSITISVRHTSRANAPVVTSPILEAC